MKEMMQILVNSHSWKPISQTLYNFHQIIQTSTMFLKSTHSLMEIERDSLLLIQSTWLNDSDCSVEVSNHQSKNRRDTKLIIIKINEKVYRSSHYLFGTLWQPF